MLWAITRSDWIATNARKARAPINHWVLGLGGGKDFAPLRALAPVYSAVRTTGFP